jgi:Tfp pilus assembly protein PilF
MGSSRRITAWLLFFVCTTAGLALAEQRARLVGKIVDPDGKPVPGVAVTATSPQIPKFREALTTDKKGAFIIDFDDIDVTYHYRFEKVGYQPLEVNQIWKLEGTQRYEWTIVPGGPTTAGGPPPVSTSQQAIVAFNGGITALKAKDYATAEIKFKEAAQHDPKLAPAWAALSAVQVQTGHNQEAVEAAEKAMALGARDEAVLTARWQAYRSLKDDAKAAEALKDLETVGRRAEEAKKIHNEGVALTKAGDNAGACAKFQEALEVDPNLQPALLGLAAAALKIGRNAEAATAAETVLKGDPKNDQALRLRYNACLSLGDSDRLFDSLVGLAAVEPTIAINGLLKLAIDAYDASDTARAKARFLKVVDVDSSQPLGHYYLAMVYVSEGATADARSHLERFLVLAPNSPEAATVREMLQQLDKF